MNLCKIFYKKRKIQEESNYKENCLTEIKNIVNVTTNKFKLLEDKNQRTYSLK